LKAIFANILAIPLSTSLNWEVLSYRSIPANQIEFTKPGLQINVDKSASPLIYKFSQTEPIFQIEVEGRVSSGTLNLIDPKQQGLKKNDDFVLRLGLVTEGSKKLNWAQKLAAPAWIKRLHDVAPKGKGIHSIHFLEVSQTAELVGTKRTHYLSDLMTEEIVTSLNSDGSFRFTKTMSSPLPVLGLWLSTDGDDSGSKFQVVISRIDLFKRPDN
jgi:hypothetical protein